MDEIKNFQKLRVIQALKSDSGRGRVRIANQILSNLSLNPGDVIQIINPNSRLSTSAYSFPGVSEDSGSEIIRLDSSQRRNIDVEINDFVIINKINAFNAETIIFRGLKLSIIIRNADQLVNLLENRVVSQGDILSFNVTGRRIDLIITELVPKQKTVIIKSDTKIIVESSPFVTKFLLEFEVNLNLFHTFYYMKLAEFKKDPSPLNKIRQNTLDIRELEKDSDLYILDFDELKVISFEDITFENLLKFENRYYLLNLYSEMEQYLFKTFSYVLLKYPKILKDKSIPLFKLLEEGFDLETVLQNKIEEELNDLFFKDFDKIFNYLRKKIGIKLTFTKNKISQINEFRQFRNAYIHGDGKVSTLFLSRVTTSDYKLGDILPLDQKKLKEFQNLVFYILYKFDRALIEKIPELLKQ